MERPPKECCCCFTGHRQRHFPFSTESAEFAAFRAALDRAVEEAAKSGRTHFLSGMCEGVDLWGAESVLRLRERDPRVTLEAVVPFAGQERSWAPADRALYRELLEQCQITTVMAQGYYKGCYFVRDRFLVDNASMMIAACAREEGGSRFTMDYALRHAVPVVNLLEGLEGTKPEV